MKTFVLATILGLCTLTTAAQADGPTFVRGQFAARVERGQPVGDEAAIASAFPLVYWVEMRNPGPSAPVTRVRTMKAEGSSAGPTLAGSSAVGLVTCKLGVTQPWLMFTRLASHRPVTTAPMLSRPPV